MKLSPAKGQIDIFQAYFEANGNVFTCTIVTVQLYFFFFLTTGSSDVPTLFVRLSSVTDMTLSLSIELTLSCADSLMW